jgi:hypothetical protein
LTLLLLLELAAAVMTIPYSAVHQAAAAAQ